MFDAITQFGATHFSTSLNTSSLTSISSKTASITTSHFLNPEKSVARTRFCLMFSRMFFSRRPFSTFLSNRPKIASLASLPPPGLASNRTTFMPPSRETCTMPCPIAPPPTTPIKRSSDLVFSSISDTLYYSCHPLAYTYTHRA